MYLKFAWRYFKAKKSANAINIIAWVTVGVIAFATACQILVLSVFNGFEDLVKSLYASFYTDIKIVPTNGKTFTLTPEQITSIKKQPDVNAVSLIAEERGIIKNDDAQTTVYLKGVDDNYVNVSGVPAKTTQGSFNIGTLDDPGLVVGYGIQNAAAIDVEGIVEPSLPTLILPAKFESFGWEVLHLVKGNDIDEVVASLEKAKTLTGNGKPIVILMTTAMGSGVDFMEGSHEWHGIAPNDEQLAKALAQLPETLGDY